MPLLGLPRVLEYSSTTRVINYSSNFLLLEYHTRVLVNFYFRLQISISGAVLVVNCWYFMETLGFVISFATCQPENRFESCRGGATQRAASSGLSGAGECTIRGRFFTYWLPDRRKWMTYWRKNDVTVAYGACICECFRKNLVKKMAEKRQRSSFVLDESINKVRCKYCKESFVYSNNTSNMIKHLQARHSYRLDESGQSGHADSE